MNHGFRLACLLGLSSLTIAAMAADQLAPSSQPPGGFNAEQVPQFILFGFDDNQVADPITWFVDHVRARRNPAGTGQSGTFDGGSVRAIFFSNGRYWTDPAIVAIHRRAVRDGHELGNHTQTHPHGLAFSVDQWRAEMDRCDQVYAEAGIPVNEIAGFRAPYLQYGHHTFLAMLAMGRLYDASIQEGYQPEQDGTNFLWPYTLDEGSPGNGTRYPTGSPRLIQCYAGLWEIPLHVFIVPTDEQCVALGIPPGLRQRMQANVDPREDHPAGGKITGLDWNVLESAKITGPEYFAILKHSLDLRLQGNRAPFMIGAHTSLYPDNQPERRRAIEEFISYALTKSEVRFKAKANLILETDP
jgi:peptidoglycan/xylan/chitin deacetylase (PgdA/CDA1 family)